MCSFIFTNRKIEDLNTINRVTKFRGPDLTIYKEINEFNYIHNLLSITGELTPQPIEKEGIVCVYNGEIYNFTDFGDFNSDGESIIEAYKKYGTKFTKQLDGEFAIVLVDYNKNLIIISSDTFRTKPLFYSIHNNDIGISTYSEPLRLLNFNTIKKFIPNNIFISVNII